MAASYGGPGTTGNVRDGRVNALFHQRLDLFAKLVDLTLCISH